MFAGRVLAADRPIMFLQHQDISSSVNADYVKQDTTLPGIPRFSFTLTIKASVPKVFYDHTKSEKMRHYSETSRVKRWG